MARARKASEENEETIRHDEEETGNGFRAPPPSEPDPPPSIPVLAPPQNGTGIMSAKARAEVRKEAEREDLVGQLNEFTRGLDINAGKYTFNLYRTEPKWSRGRVTGTDTGMLIASYAGKHPEIEEIMQEHGGEQYHFRVKGPNPENPGKDRNWTFKLPRIAGEPKTVSTHNGTLPIDQAPLPNQQPAQDGAFSLVREVMKTMTDKNTEAIELIKSMAFNQPKAPSVDPALLEAQAASREERRQAHEKEIARINAEAVTRAAEVKAAAEADKARRDEEREERKQAHELALKKMETDAKIAEQKFQLDAEARKADADARRQDMKDFLKVIDDNRKETSAQFAKIAERMDDKNDSKSVIKTMLEIEDLKDRLTGRDKKEDSGSISDVLKESLPKAMDTLKFAIERVTGGGGGSSTPAQPAQRQITPGTVVSMPVPGTEQPPPPAAVQPDAAPQELPPFVFPTDETPPGEAIQMLGANIELALRAKWLGPKIFSDVVEKFPAAVIGLVKMTPLDQAMDAIEKTAPGDAVLRSPRGKTALRIIYGLLKQRGES
jgi:hypothetical protein